MIFLVRTLKTTNISGTTTRSAVTMSCGVEQSTVLPSVAFLGAVAWGLGSYRASAFRGCHGYIDIYIMR